MQKIIRGLKRVMIQRLDQLSMYRKQVKNRNMHTTFWKITKDLANSDVNKDMLKIFDIDQVESTMRHLISFIGCEPFLKEVKRIQPDIERYQDF